MSTMRLRSITTECSISELTISQSSPIAVNGPTKLSTSAGAGADDRPGRGSSSARRSAPASIDDPAVERRLRRRPCRRRAARSSRAGGGWPRAAASSLPVSIHQPVEQLAADAVAVVDEPLDGVGDLELAPRRRLDGPHGLVDARGRRGRRRRGRGRVGGSAGFSTRRTTLPSASSSAMPKRCGSGTCLSRICAAGGVGSSARAARNSADEGGQVLLEQVVAEVHDEVVVAEEVAGDEHAVGQAERRVLGDVGDLQRRTRLPSPTAAITSSRVSPTMMPISVMPAATIASMPVEQDRLVGHRHELLGARVGDRAQPRAGAAGEDRGPSWCRGQGSATV